RKQGPAVPQNESGWFGLPKAADLVFRVPGESDAGGALPLRGIGLDTPVRFAPKGGAVPGERIVGVREKDSIVIYPIHSPALTAFDDRPELWLDVRWDLENTPSAVYSTQIVVTLLNEPGALGVIATTIGEYGANIDAVVTSPSGADFRRFVIDLQVRDIQHLNAVLSQLRDKSVVHNVERLSG
ncbi:MAG: RelA/SpoT AH/RIS domain-containing protein, partial [Roseiarcus sp.]